MAQRGKYPLLASANLVRQSQLRAVPEQRDWQTRAWEFFDLVGEARFAAQWIGNALSRCRLYVGMPDEDGAGTPEPLGDDEDDSSSGGDVRARIPLDELFGGATGHPEMLSRMALHLTVPGESYLIAWDGVDDATGERVRRWMVASSEEFTRNGNNVRIRLPETDKQVQIKLDSSTVIRLWRPHPRRHWEADSPMRAALPILKELVGLDAHIAATVDSRLAGAGLLLLPESATLPAAMNGDENTTPLHEDPAMATLIDAMVTPIGNRDSAAAVVPIIARVPDAAAGKWEYITFSTKLDEKIRELREASIRRFATVVDIPAEVMSGAASNSAGTVSRWGMWKIEESAIKLHVEPLLGLICDALTTQYLWPALTALGIADPCSYVIWYDVSELVLRPNRGPEAQNLYDAGGLVSGKTVRRSNGFSEDDKPDTEEAQRILLMQLAEKGVDPLLVAPYLKKLGIDLELPEPAAPAPPGRPEQQPGQQPGDLGPGTRDEGRPPNPTRLPTRPEPLPAHPDSDEVTAAASAVEPPVEPAGLHLAAVEFAAMRALELAGKRLLNNSNRSWRGQLRRVEPWEIHTQIPVPNPDDVLEGAYALMHRCIPDQPRLHEVVDTYVRERLSSQNSHDRELLFTMLAKAGCLPGLSRAVA